MTSEERADNASHSPTTDPGAAAALLDALPCDSARLPEAVSALVMDRQFAAGLRVAVAPDSAGDPECRTIRRILGRLRALDPAPLDVPRPPERRLIGVCRDHALLACAALRHHGVPARLRAGLASYFRAGHHEDHVVCEYHAGDRWRLADSELTGPVRDHFGIAFDPADVPRDAFLVGGDAWQRLRRGALDPARCGVSFIGIAGGVVRGRQRGARRGRARQARDAAVGLLGPRPRLRPGHGRPGPRGGAAGRGRRTAGPEPSWKALRDACDHGDDLRVPSTVVSCPAGERKHVPVEA